MFGGVSLGRIFGIELKIDWSWLLIFLLIVWNLGASFSDLNPEWSAVTVVATAVIAALLFFGSVLAHELAHSLVAIQQGMSVRSITLFLFGGVSNIQREPPSPKAEFWITIVGPVTSFILGGIFLILASISVDIGQTTSDINETIRSISAPAVVVLWLGSINIVLGLFNLIPGFPLDGGRILRSILWGITDNLRQATRWASWVGQAVAWYLIVSGIAMIFGATVPIFGTGTINGIWMAFIGWFLNSSSSASYQQVVIRDVLEGVPVRKVMRQSPPTVAPDISVDTLLHDYVMQTDDYAFPVLDNSQLVGIVTLSDMRSLDRDKWAEKTVRDIMTPSDKLTTVGPDEESAEALQLLTSNEYRQLPVVENGQFVGLLRRRDIIKWLQLQSDINKGLIPGRSAAG